MILRRMKTTPFLIASAAAFAPGEEQLFGIERQAHIEDDAIIASKNLARPVFGLAGVVDVDSAARLVDVPSYHRADSEGPVEVLSLDEGNGRTVVGAWRCGVHCARKD